MPDPYTQINLAEVEDAAPANGFGDRWEARGARTSLDAEQTGVTHFRLRPGKRSPFMHRHGLEFLAVGPHHQGDGEPVNDPWVA